MAADSATQQDDVSDDDDGGFVARSAATASCSTAEIANKRKSSRKRFVIINTSKCRYDIVRQAALELGWCIEDDDRPDVSDTYCKSSEHVALVHKLFPNFRYKPDETPQVHWVDVSVLLPRVSSMKCFHRLNHFPNMHLICRKMIFFSRCMRLQLQFPEYYNFFPKSFSLRSDLKQLEDYFRSLRGRTKTFVMKPNTGCQGKGILLTRQPLKVAKTLKDQDYIVQLYVHRPLLIERKKFDMRVYVLMTFGGSASLTPSEEEWWIEPSAAGGGLQLFVHREGLVRICSEDYSKPTSENLSDVYKHLTNYALNKNNDNYVYAGQQEENGSDAVDLADEGDGTEGFTGNKRDFRFLEQFVDNDASLAAALCGGASAEDEDEDDASGVAPKTEKQLPLKQSSFSSSASPWTQLLRRIDRAVVLSVVSGVHEVRQAYQAAGCLSGPRADGKNCFELMGFDVMVTSSGHVHVLEINHSPSLCCDTALDVRIKKSVVTDCLRIVTRGLPDLRKCTDLGYKKHNDKLRLRELTDRQDPTKDTDFRQVFPLPIDAPGEYTSTEMRVYRDVWFGTKSTSAGSIVGEVRATTSAIRKDSGIVTPPPKSGGSMRKSTPDTRRASICQAGPPARNAKSASSFLPPLTETKPR